MENLKNQKIIRIKIKMRKNLPKIKMKKRKLKKQK